MFFGLTLNKALTRIPFYKHRFLLVKLISWAILSLIISSTILKIDNTFKTNVDWYYRGFTAKQSFRYTINWKIQNNFSCSTFFKTDFVHSKSYVYRKIYFVLFLIITAIGDVLSFFLLVLKFHYI